MHDFVHLFAGDAQGRAYVEDVAVDAKYQPLSLELFVEAFRHSCVGGKSRFRLAVADKFDGEQQTDAAHIADKRMVYRKPFELLLEVRAHLRRVLHEVIVLDNLDVLQRGGGGYGMAGCREHMAQQVLLARECVRHFLPDYRGSHGQVAADDALRHGHDVRHDAPMLQREHLAGAPEAAYHLVGD